MIKTSEFVSVGHPDKVADYISSYVLDRFLERDPQTRYAVEVQVKDECATLAGEVTSRAGFTPEDIAGFVREAVNEIGYTREYKNTWGNENTVCGDDLDVTVRIGRQSPDIAQGVDRDAWGDQGIFWGMAVDSPETGYMPRDHWLAKSLAQYLYGGRLAGIDIKTQVTLDGGRPEEIVVAIPELPAMAPAVDAAIAEWRKRNGCEGGRLVVNGTGRFVMHGPRGDCGTTGRKLAVDFYGGNCRIGGGSPWTKDATKADLALNLYARHAALEYLKSHPGTGTVYCALSCRIGGKEVRASFLDGSLFELWNGVRELPPDAVAGMFRLREPRFARMCREGLFQCR